jgi:bifunctional NMN adenylyltransferase/nudix hydrolase
MKSWKNNEVNYDLDLAVIIGRFQPLHKAHLKLLEKASLISSNSLVLIGSSFIARNVKNPFTYQEREQMVKFIYPDFSVRPIVDDLYNDQRWVGEVQAAVEQELESLGLNPKTAKVGLVGYFKDESSYYLNMFPRYQLVEIVDKVESLDGTDIRRNLFGYGVIFGVDQQIEEFLQNWRNKNSEIYQDLCNEFKFLGEYKSQFSSMKFPPVFVTADAVVINKGHILLVRRRSHPGKGLWALPGGFLNQHETIENAILRELIEETKIKVSPLILKASLKGTHVFDSPYRSLRGRTITHAGLVVLNTPELPHVKGSDDAEKANWFPISEFYAMSENLFEDHHSIGQYMINRA